MIYNQTKNTHLINLTFGDFDGISKNIRIKKFLVFPEKKPIEIKFSAKFLLNSTLTDDFLLEKFSKLFPLPFEVCNFDFLYHYIPEKENLAKSKVVLTSEIINNRDFIIELHLNFEIINKNIFTIEFLEYKVFKNIENIEEINLFENIIKTNDELRADYIKGYRRLKLKRDESDKKKIDLLQNSFIVDYIDIFIKSKPVSRLVLAGWRNFEKTKVAIPISISQTFFIYARNCQVYTKTMTDYFKNDTNLIGFIYSDIYANEAIEIIPKELGSFEVDYNSYLEFYDEDNTPVNFDKIILFYELYI